MKHNIGITIKTGLAASGGFLAYWLGGFDNLLVTLLSVTVIDYLTGLLKAVHTRTLSSHIGFRGIVRKVHMLAVVALAFIVENLVGGELPLREVVIIFFVANEGISILENAAQAGLPIPTKLRMLLNQLTAKGSAGDD